MMFNKLSYWGIFKVSLILDFVIPLLLAPFLLVGYMVAPDRFDFELDRKLELHGTSIDFGSGDITITANIFLALILFIIGLMIQCAVLYFLAQKTRLGRIKIGG